MSTKPETNFYESLHRRIKKHEPKIHVEKMYNPYRGGTWDVWYSGYGSDLWVEYKWLPKIPVRPTTLVVPGLSALQLEWGAGRYTEGRNLAVILGCPEGGVVYQDTAWEEELEASTFRSMLRTRGQLAEFIIKQVIS